MYYKASSCGSHCPLNISVDKINKNVQNNENNGFQIQLCRPCFYYAKKKDKTLNMYPDETINRNHNSLCLS